jgi:chromosome segregation ATPase
MAEEDHEVRELRFRLKQANKVMGRQGDTIYQLRGQLAELREITGKLQRGDVRNTERELGRALEDNERLREKNEQLLAELGQLRNEAHPDEAHPDTSSYTEG